MFRRYFIAGLLVLLPIWITLLIIKFVVDIVDQSLSLLPNQYQPDNLLRVHIPGLGLIFTILFVFLVGMLVTNIIGKRLLIWWEAILVRIPLVRSIYGAVKQVTQAIFSSTGDSFRKVLLVEYPRKGMWSIAFQTGTNFSIASVSDYDKLVTVFVPTTPNPTSGFLLMLPRQDVIELNMTIDEALKYVVSLGVVVPASMTDFYMASTSKESI